MTEIHCHSCKTKHTFQHSVGLRDACPQCNADLHVCLNCKHYDANSYNECREPVAERVRDKDRSNFCDQFVPGGASSSAAKATADQLKELAESLFKKGSS